MAALCWVRRNPVSEEAPARNNRKPEADLLKDMATAEELRLKSKQKSLCKHLKGQQEASASTKEKTPDSKWLRASIPTPGSIVVCDIRILARDIDWIQ